MIINSIGNDSYLAFKISNMCNLWDFFAFIRTILRNEHIPSTYCVTLKFCCIILCGQPLIDHNVYVCKKNIAFCGITMVAAYVSLQTFFNIYTGCHANVDNTKPYLELFLNTCVFIPLLHGLDVIVETLV